MNGIKKFFFNALCVYLGIAESFSSGLSPSQIEDLTNNVYRVTSVSYSIPLTGHIMEINEQDIDKLGQKTSKFNHAFSFIKDRQENAFFILHMGNENLLSYASSKSKKLKYQKLRSMEDKVRKNFLWSINLIPDKPNSIVTIKPLNEDKFLVFKKTEDEREEGQTSTVYNLALEDKVKDEPLDVSFFSFPEFSNSEWRLSPFYPSSGYSDFSKIILDVGELIANRYKTELVHIKTAPSSSHDFAFLSVNCLEKTALEIDPFSKSCKSYKREIFRIGDVFDSVIQSQLASSVKITRAIETEQIFQTTIENCLSRSKKEGKAVSKRDSHKQLQSRGEDSEVMDQEGFSESLNTLLSLSIAKKVDRSSAIMERGSEESSLSTGHDSHFDSSLGQSQGESESEGSESSISAQTGVSITGVGSAGLSVSHGLSHRKEKSKNTTRSTSSGKSSSSQKGKSSIREKTSEQRDSVGKEKHEGEQKGQEKSRQDMHQFRNLRNHQSSEEWSIEADKLQEFSLEESLSLSEVRSVTKKKNEKWFIERELHQIPGTFLQVRFFEQVFEAINYPFEARLKMSGYIGFTFKDYVPIAHNRSIDYRETQTWFLSPATILEYIKAPGYKKNKDGSIDYVVRGKINLRQPLNIFTVIKEIPYPSKKD